MTKDNFILKDGQVQTPHPIYPNEVRNESSSLGGMKNTEITTIDIELADPVKGKASFRLIKKELSELLHS